MDHTSDWSLRREKQRTRRQREGGQWMQRRSPVGEAEGSDSCVACECVMLTSSLRTRRPSPCCRCSRAAPEWPPDPARHANSQHTVQDRGEHRLCRSVWGGVWGVLCSRGGVWGGAVLEGWCCARGWPSQLHTIVSALSSGAPPMATLTKWNEGPRLYARRPCWWEMLLQEYVLGSMGSARFSCLCGMTHRQVAGVAVVEAAADVPHHSVVVVARLVDDVHNYPRARGQAERPRAVVQVVHEVSADLRRALVRVSPPGVAAVSVDVAGEQMPADTRHVDQQPLGHVLAAVHAQVHMQRPEPVKGGVVDAAAVHLGRGRPVQHAGSLRCPRVGERPGRKASLVVAERCTWVSSTRPAEAPRLRLLFPRAAVARGGVAGRRDELQLVVSRTPERGVRGAGGAAP